MRLHAHPLRLRNLNWWLGGQLAPTKTGLAIWRKVAAPLEAPIMKATRGRVRLNFAVPIVVLSSTGARSGERREIPLAYFTDGDDVILIASNYGGTATRPGITTCSPIRSASCISESAAAALSLTKCRVPTAISSTRWPWNASTECSPCTMSEAAILGRSRDAADACAVGVRFVELRVSRVMT